MLHGGPHAVAAVRHLRRGEGDLERAEAAQNHGLVQAAQMADPERLAAQTPRPPATDTPSVSRAWRRIGSASIPSPLRIVVTVTERCSGTSALKGRAPARLCGRTTMRPVRTVTEGRMAGTRTAPSALSQAISRDRTIPGMSIEAPPLERKLVAILAADVEGYSRLMHVDEEATLAMLSSHRLIVDGLIAATGGHITSTAGDSVLAEFASVVEAVICAVEIQRSLALANEPVPPDRRMQFRIGLNVGDVMVKDGGIFGDGVNVAARVEALAPPGGICVTRGVRDHVRDRLPYGFEDIGDHAVKNIARPIHAFRIVFDGEYPRGRDRPIGLVSMPAEASSQPAEPVEVELTFWKSAEAGGTAEEYQAYLDHFPDGTFASLAQARLEVLSGPPAPVQADPAVELAFWDSVKDGTDPALFSAYLDKYPDGEFRAIAEIKLAALG